MPVFTRFTFYLNTGGQREYRSTLPITLAIATATGQQQYGAAFAYAEEKP